MKGSVHFSPTPFDLSSHTIVSDLIACYRYHLQFSTTMKNRHRANHLSIDIVYCLQPEHIVAIACRLGNFVTNNSTAVFAHLVKIAEREVNNSADI